MFELVRSPNFANLPVVVEDFVKDYGGSYTGEISTGTVISQSFRSYISLVSLFFLLCSQ